MTSNAAKTESLPRFFLYPGTPRVTDVAFSGDVWIDDGQRFLFEVTVNNTHETFVCELGSTRISHLRVFTRERELVAQFCRGWNVRPTKGTREELATDAVIDRIDDLYDETVAPWN